MRTPPEYPSFEEAYLDVLRHICTHFQYRNAPRGNASHECIGLSFRLSHPRERVPYLAARKINPVFHYAEALWYLSGRDDLEMLAYYSPSMKKFSLDGRTLGSAYGARLFALPPGGTITQFDRVLHLLRHEGDSKRAVLSVFRPEELAVPDNPDVSCVVALHLMAREGRLHMVCYMRANDANRGLVADTFSFTLIQEFAAVLLGLEVGTYTHHVGSMHIRDQELPLVREILDEAATRSVSPRVRFPFPAMSRETTSRTLATVMKHEEALRHNLARIHASDVTNLDLPPYWQQVVLLFEVYRQIAHHPDEPITDGILDRLAPGLRWLMAHRWPKQVAAAAPEVTR